MLGRPRREIQEWQSRERSPREKLVRTARCLSSSSSPPPSFPPSSPQLNRTAEQAMATSKSTLDLQAARKTATFDSDELNRLLNEGSRDPEVSTTGDTES